MWSSTAARDSPRRATPASSRPTCAGLMTPAPGAAPRGRARLDVAGPNAPQQEGRPSRAAPRENRERPMPSIPRAQARLDGECASPASQQPRPQARDWSRNGIIRRPATTAQGVGRGGSSYKTRVTTAASGAMEGHGGSTPSGHNSARDRLPCLLAADEHPIFTMERRHQRVVPPEDHHLALDAEMAFEELTSRGAGIVVRVRVFADER